MNAATGKDITQDATVEAAATAIDQVLGAQGALSSVGVHLQPGPTGAEILQRYQQFDTLDLNKISTASEVLAKAAAQGEQIRAEANSAAGGLQGAWSDSAGQAAAGNYQQAAGRATTDLGKLQGYSKVYGMYAQALRQALTTRHGQCHDLAAQLLASLGQYRTTGAITAACQEILALQNQKPAAANLQGVVDAKRHELQAKVADPTSFGATQFKAIITDTDQQAQTATDTALSAFQSIDTSPYKVPEFPITCEPDQPQDSCGCKDEKPAEKSCGCTEALAVPVAPTGGGAGGGAGGGSAGGGSGGGSAGGGSGGGGDTPAAAPAGAPAATDSGSADSGSADSGLSDSGSAGSDSPGSGSGGSAPDLGFLGDIVSGLAGAFGQLGQGAMGALGSGMDAVGNALSGTDLSGFAGKDAAAASTDAKGLGGEDGAVLPDGAVSLPDGTVALPDDALALDGALGLPDGAVALSGDLAPDVLAPEGGAAIGGGLINPGVVAGTSGGGYVAPASQGGHGEFEVEANEIPVPIIAEEPAPAPSVCVVPPTPAYTTQSVVPSF